MGRSQASGSSSGPRGPAYPFPRSRGFGRAALDHKHIERDVQGHVQLFEQDPEVGHIFRDIRQHGAEAMMRHYHDKELMLKISHKMRQFGVVSEGLREGPGPLPQAQRQLLDPKLETRHAAEFYAEPWSGPASQASLPDPPAREYHSDDSAAGFTTDEDKLYGPAPCDAGADSRGYGLAAPALPASPHSGSAHMAQTVSSLPEELAQRATLGALRSMPYSVALADPGVEDCPLIGCSEGFEELTGYSSAEIVGQNCRFLNRGVAMDTETRQALRDAVNFGREFIGVIPNVRKDGRPFQNLLHLTVLTLRGKQFLVAVQADVTEVDLGKTSHVAEIQSVAERVFAGHLDAWVQLQARELSRQPDAQHQTALVEFRQEGAPEIQSVAQRVLAGHLDAWAQMQTREFWVWQPVSYAGQLRNTAPAEFKKAQDELVAVQLSHAQMPAPCQSACSTTPPASEPASPMLRCPSWAGSATPSTQAEVPARFPGARDGSGADRGDRRVSAGAGTALASVGSAGHPDSCAAECVFFFFSARCMAGADCRFCHVFHWRKNEKKNRRAVRRGRFYASATAGTLDALPAPRAPGAAPQPVGEQADTRRAQRGKGRAAASPLLSYAEKFGAS